MLFHRRTKKIMRVVWGVIGAFIILSMVLLYTPLFGTGSHSAGVAAPAHSGQPVQPAQSIEGAPPQPLPEQEPRPTEVDFSPEAR